MRKIIILYASLTALFVFCLAGCATSSGTPGEGAVASETKAASDAESGVEKPLSFGLSPVSTKGLAVYGSGQLKAGSDKVSVEIDAGDLDKVETGGAVSLTNLSDMSNPIMYKGTVTALPESVSDINDICYIEVTLEIEDPTDAMSSPSEQQSDAALPEQTENASGDQTISSSSSISGTSDVRI